MRDAAALSSGGVSGSSRVYFRVADFFISEHHHFQAPQPLLHRHADDALPKVQRVRVRHGAPSARENRHPAPTRMISPGSNTVSEVWLCILGSTTEISHGGNGGTHHVTEFLRYLRSLRVRQSV